MDIYNLLLGISIAIVFQFIALVYHVAVSKKERFLYWWLIGNGMIVLGIITGFARQIPQLEKCAIITLNSLVILGQGCYYIAVETYLDSQFKLDKLRITFGIGFIFMIYLSVFLNNTVIRMLSSSIILFLFSLLSAKCIYQHKTEGTDKSSYFLMITFIINSLFWVFRFIFVYFVLPYHLNLYNLILALSYISVLMLSTFGTLGIILLINQKLVYGIEKEHLKFLAIFETSPDYIIITELDTGKIVLTNTAFLNALGYKNEEVINKTSTDLYIWKDNSLREKFITDIKNNQQLDYYESVFRKKDGSTFIGSLSVSILNLNKKYHIMSMIRDITEQKNAEYEILNLAEQLKKEKEAAEKISLTDGMTGLSNRRYLDDQVILEYFRMKRTGQPLSIIMLDVDFFKLYNDTYGHLQGDECLKNVAKVMKSSVKRATDITARYGGEEFVVLLPDTGDSGAEIVAERIRQNVELLGMEHLSSKIAPVVTVSIGTATFNKYSDISPEMMLQKADEALYKAKNSGRNCVIKNLDIIDKKEENFLRIVWSVNFESGHDKIDEQHKKLFESSNKIFENMFYLKSHEEQKKAIVCLMDDLKDHFAYEEEVLSEINYPEKAYHSTSHEKLMNNAEILIKKFDKKEIQAVEVLNFIIFDVIAEHLYKQDTLYFPYINVEKTNV